MSVPISDPERLRAEAQMAQRKANSLPVDHPERRALNQLAHHLDECADEIEALSPDMRADLEAMIASVRPN